MVIHDVSHFAQSFDVKGSGGVRRAFDEWRVANPLAENSCSTAKRDQWTSRGRYIRMHAASG